jgi:hypothetical protein
MPKIANISAITNSLRYPILEAYLEMIKSTANSIMKFDAIRMVVSVAEIPRCVPQNTNKRGGKFIIIAWVI